MLEPCRSRRPGWSASTISPFTGRGDDILATLNGPNTVLHIRSRGTTTVLDATGGLQNPTSVALRGKDVYVLSAAYTTGSDPKLLRARLRTHR